MDRRLSSARWRSSPQATQSYPPPIIYLALLKQQRGEATEARRLLL